MVKKLLFVTETLRIEMASINYKCDVGYAVPPMFQQRADSLDNCGVDTRPVETEGIPKTTGIILSGWRH